MTARVLPVVAENYTQAQDWARQVGLRERVDWRYIGDPQLLRGHSGPVACLEGWRDRRDAADFEAALALTRGWAWTPVRGYVRDFDPARDIDLYPYDPRPGSRLVIVDALFADQSRGHGVTRWVPLDRPRNCRMRVDREGKRRACGEPAVVAMMRPHGLHHEVPWGYCAKHVGDFLARWEGGRVLRAQTIDAEVSD